MSPRSPANASLTVLLAMLLASCGGGGAEIVASGGGNPLPGASVQPPQQTGSQGTLHLTIQDASGAYVPGGATVTIFNATQSQILLSEVTPNWAPAFRVPTGPVIVSVAHALGYARVENMRIQEGRNQLKVVLVPAVPVTAALFPVRIPPGGINAARTELELEVTVVASPRATFRPPSYAKLGSPAPTPMLVLENCATWLETPAEPPVCRFDQAGPASIASYEYQGSGLPQLFPAQATFAAALMIEMGNRVYSADSRYANQLGARTFIDLTSGTADQAGANLAYPVGLAKVPNTTAWNPLYLAPVGAPSGPQLWSQSRQTLSDAISMILFPEEWISLMVKPQGIGGGPYPETFPVPVIDGLSAVYRLVDSTAPADRRRAVVAMVAGGDATGLTDVQAETAMQALRQQQDAAAIRTILVAGRLEELSPQRAGLADLAQALGAPLIFQGYPRDWTHVIDDGTHAAMILASELLSGASLPTIKAVFRMRAEPSQTFQSGQVLRGRVWIETAQCAMGCTLLPLDFSVRIP